MRRRDITPRQIILGFGDRISQMPPPVIRPQRSAPSLIMAWKRVFGWRPDSVAPRRSRITAIFVFPLSLSCCRVEDARWELYVKAGKTAILPSKRASTQIILHGNMK